MILNSRTAERMVKDIQECLGGGVFAYISVNETTGRVETFTTGHELRSGGWTDESPESVRLFTHDDGRPWIGFSIAGFFFSVQEGEDIWVDRSEMKYRHVAPCGDVRMEWFRWQGERP